jgi:hypothetical protein
MLQAYIDDTEYQQTPPLFMLAGYLASAEAWTSFSSEWQLVLDISPRLTRFKVKEAIKRYGPFRRMSERDRLERIALFRRVIERWVDWEFAIVFRGDWLREVFEPLGKPHTNPYFYAARTLVAELVHYIAESKFRGQQLDVIFDNRAIEQNVLIEAWTTAAASASATSAFSILKNPPYFQDDEQVLPLQAADMHATLSRMHMTEDLAEEDVPGFTRRIAGFGLFPDKDELKSYLTDFLTWYGATRGGGR